jgi:hypothetical protein
VFPLLLSTIPAHRANRSLPVIRYPHLPDPSKNKLQNHGAFFATEKNTIQRTTIYQQPTTNSPPKNHVQHTIFLKNP